MSCSATDAANNANDCGFTVTVADTVSPDILCPGNQVVECAGPDGAAVSFNVTATDICFGTLPTTCTASSGSLFALGDTPVSCTAADGANTGETHLK